MAWEIIGYDSTKEIWRGEASGRFGERRISAILQCLAARDLTQDEILSGMSGSTGLLKVTKGKAMMCGTNPYYVARWEK